MTSSFCASSILRTISSRNREHFTRAARLQWAEPNFIQEYEKSEVPNDPRFGQQWHLKNTGQGGGTAGRRRPDCAGMGY